MKTISPCLECPYKLGLVQTFTNPCPQCELEGYKNLRYSEVGQNLMAQNK